MNTTESKNSKKIAKIIEAIENGHLSIENSGTKHWHSYTFVIQNLTWVRDFADGFRISIFQKNDQIGELTIDYSSDRVYTYSALLSKDEVTERIKTLRN